MSWGLCSLFVHPIVYVGSWLSWNLLRGTCFYGLAVDSNGSKLEVNKEDDNLAMASGAADQKEKPNFKKLEAVRNEDFITVERWLYLNIWKFYPGKVQQEVEIEF